MCRKFSPTTCISCQKARLFPIEACDDVVGLRRLAHKPIGETITQEEIDMYYLTMQCFNKVVGNLPTGSHAYVIQEVLSASMAAVCSSCKLAMVRENNPEYRDFLSKYNVLKKTSETSAQWL